MDKEILAILDVIAAKRRHVPTWEEIGKLPYSRTASILKADGLLAKSLTGYQERPSQMEMAQALDQALDQELHAIVEAPTGTGKSLAYLIAVVEARKKAIISTANKTLQDQLFKKDIPFVHNIRQFKAALLKGKSNYLCLSRLEKYRQDVFEEANNDSTLRKIAAKIDDVDFKGDFEELSFVNDTLRSKINVDEDDCARKKCRFFKECYYYQARAKLKDADVIIVNHDLLMINAASGGKMLPSPEVIVIDEAHSLEETATKIFSIEVKPTRITTLLKKKKLMRYTSHDTLYATDKQFRIVWDILEKYFSNPKLEKIWLKNTIEEGLHLALYFGKLASELTENRPAGLSEEDDEKYDKLIKQTERLAEDLRVLFKVENKQSVYYLEKAFNKRNEIQINIVCVPLSVSSHLKSLIFDIVPVLCVSATLATPMGNAIEDDLSKFDYFRSRVGIEGKNVVERVLQPVFNYKENALLYIPNDIVEPDYGYGDERECYEHSMSSRILQLVQLSKGRAFLLFSSKRMLNAVYNKIAHKMHYPLIKQGDMTRDEMIQQFRLSGNGVLFGLKSFWEGVDIAGETLSLVVIDKVPFNSPDDPVHKARKAQILTNSFMLYDAPQVVTKLKQGVGRLIRTDTDRGVMAILDSRFWNKGYSRWIIGTLPPAPLTLRLQDVATFFSRKG